MGGGEGREAESCRLLLSARACSPWFEGLLFGAFEPCPARPDRHAGLLLCGSELGQFAGWLGVLRVCLSACWSRWCCVLSRVAVTERAWWVRLWFAAGFSCALGAVCQLAVASWGSLSSLFVSFCVGAVCLLA